MKGISTVLATIILLMVTLALIGTAVGFIFGWWGRATQAVEVVGEGQCLEGQGTNGQDLVVIKLRNPNPTGNVTVEVKQIAPSADTQVATNTITIEPGQVVEFRDDCGGSGARYCTYSFTPPMGMFSVTGQAYCR